MGSPPLRKSKNGEPTPFFISLFSSLRRIFLANPRRTQRTHIGTYFPGTKWGGGDRFPTNLVASRMLHKRIMGDRHDLLYHPFHSFLPCRPALRVANPQEISMSDDHNQHPVWANHFGIEPRVTPPASTRPEAEIHGSFLAKNPCGRRQPGITIASDFETRFAWFAPRGFAPPKPTPSLN